MDNEKKIEQFEKVLDKLNIKEPVPEETQKYIRENKYKSHIKLLKKIGQYTVWDGLVLYVFYGLKNRGIKSTMVQSAIIVVILGIILVTSLFAGVYLIVKYFI